ncbi:hypothetical protein NQ315_012111 [Exocentrus adspersus]|uniref:Ubiquinol-cytochrome c chaperone domain-containing protein n=1 Tax=Exocentrus adspersus TaxID=1586481 RepID=A0AAV8VXN9_9CUCU|nr:hypothetical protein NQ315_012111 [Exocentrus adspersus]
MNISRVCLSSIFRRNNIILLPYNSLRTCCFADKYTERRIEQTRPQIRYVSTYEVKDVQKEDSTIKRILNKIPFFNIEKLRAKAVAYILYESIADQINYVAIFDEFDLPDTFYSWFVITELYIWMLSARMMAEDTLGRHVRNGLVEAFWLDVAQRVKKLGAGSTAIVKQQVSELSEQLQAAFLAYDEGLQSDDTVLAGALWRRFYKGREVVLLDNMSKEQIFKEKSIRWEPIINK